MLGKRFVSFVAIGLSVVVFSGCSSAMNQIASAKVPPKIYVHSKTPEKFKDIKPYQAIWNGLAPAIVEYKQVMQCDFTPEALIALRDKGFQIVSNPNEADYRLDVEVLACGGFTHVEEKALVSVWMYDQRQEVPLEKKPLYRDFMNVAYNKDVPPYFAKVADAFKENPDKGMRLFYEYKMLDKKNAWYFNDPEHKVTCNWSVFVSNAAAKELEKTKGYLYAWKYKGMPEEDKKFIKKWLKTSVSPNEQIEYKTLSYTVGLGLIGVGDTLYGTFRQTDAGKATAALGAALFILSLGEVPNSTANRFTITDLKTNKKAFIDRNYLLTSKWRWKSTFDLGINNISRVTEHIEDVFEKLNP